MSTIEPHPNVVAKELCDSVYRDLQTSGSTSRINELISCLAADIDTTLKADICNILGHHYFHAGQFEDAWRYCAQWHAYAPDNLTAARSLISTLNRLKRWDEAISRAKEQLLRHPDDFELLSSLGNALNRSGRLDEARAYGTLALSLKDKSTIAAPEDLSNVAVPPFDDRSSEKNIVAFSLFGNADRYVKGALANARAIPFLYPSWSCRFYIDESVSDAVKLRLSDEGADLKLVSGLPSARFGTFWRFLVAEDPTVERFIVRDCDAVVNVRERLAVDEWIESRRHFHVMRDAPSHSELVLAGLWGGVAGALPPMGRTMIAYVQDRFSSRTLDQVFLREVLWPTMRQSALVHDSQFAFGERRDFPRLGQLPTGQRVGDNRF